MQKYIGTMLTGAHYQPMDVPPMDISGWIRLINHLGGNHMVDDTTEGVIDLTVPAADPRDGTVSGSERWRLIPHDGKDEA